MRANVANALTCMMYAGLRRKTNQSAWLQRSHCRLVPSLAAKTITHLLLVKGSSDRHNRCEATNSLG